MTPSMDRFLGTILDDSKADDRTSPAAPENRVDGKHVRIPLRVACQEVHAHGQECEALRHPQGRSRPASESVYAGENTRRIAAPFDGDREAAAAQKEHSGDEGVVRGRGRKVRADECVTDSEGEGGSEETQSDKDCGLLGGCIGRPTVLHGWSGHGRDEVAGVGSIDRSSVAVVMVTPMIVGLRCKSKVYLRRKVVKTIQEGAQMAPPSKSETKPRRSLTRDRVVLGGVAFADDNGIASLSMRKLGEALGVEAMSLYNHVANKDELLDGMVDLVFGEIDLPRRSRLEDGNAGAGSPPARHWRAIPGRSL